VWVLVQTYTGQFARLWRPHKRFTITRFDRMQAAQEVYHDTALLKPQDNARCH